MAAQSCEDCWNYRYDEQNDEYYCTKDLDEDEWYRFHASAEPQCPYFRLADDYYLPRRQ